MIKSKIMSPLSIGFQSGLHFYTLYFSSIQSPLILLDVCTLCTSFGEEYKLRILLSSLFRSLDFMSFKINQCNSCTYL
jgi:hypothetical protein